MASSILDELLERSNVQAYNKADIKTRGDHLVISAINLLEDIRKNYDDETAEMLERRLLAAIKSKDARKFRFNKTGS
jgi:hypothetical protein